MAQAAQTGRPYRAVLRGWAFRPNVIVLWNTIYMDAALNQLRAEGFDVRTEDVVRLSPLGFDHINMLGRYAFILPDPIARGELRPLRDPTIMADES